MNDLDINIGDKILVTTEGWFFAPDGESYKAVYGTLKNLINTEDVLGIKSDKTTAKWALKIGEMIVAGCQIHYMVKSDSCEKKKGNTMYQLNEKAQGVISGISPVSAIYFSDKEGR